MSGTYDTVTFIKAMDLIKIANQLYNDKMQYVELSIHFDDYNEDRDGEVRISAVPSADSHNVKKYPPIPPSTLHYFQ